VSPDIVSWRVFKNPLSLFIGGVAAVILELAEPRVRTGVWEHTTFRTDPIRRLRRTGLAAIVTIYGTRGKAEAMIARIRRMHDRVADLTHQAVVASRNSPTRGDPAAVSILERLDLMKLEVVHLCLEPLDPAFEFLTRANVVTARGEDEILSHQAVDCIRVLGLLPDLIAEVQDDDDAVSIGHFVFPHKLGPAHYSPRSLSDG